MSAQIWPDFALITSSMSFAETYNQEVIETRRIRAQRARFWAKLTSLLLMITIAAVLRSEPQLRAALMDAAVGGVVSLRGESQDAAALQAPARQVPGTAMADPEAIMGLLRQVQPGQAHNVLDPARQELPGITTQPAASAAPTAGAGIKVNRPGSQSGPRFQRVAPGPAEKPPLGPAGPTPDMESMAKQLGKIIGGS